jgi:hypothetical protein
VSGGPSVHLEQIDRGLPEQSHKFGDRARRMAYREDRWDWLAIIYIKYISLRAGLGFTGARS